MDQLGKIVREARDKRGETLKQMAKAIKCSESFARHIEHTKIIPVSDRLIEALQKHYRLSKPKLIRATKARNKVGNAYFKKYRRSRIA